MTEMIWKTGVLVGQSQYMFYGSVMHIK
jgi:hypothetical protein